MPNEKSLYLAHHGIMGQKWGKRNGPPYPLAPGSHSSSEKKANWQQSIKKTSLKRYGSSKAQSEKVQTRDHQQVHTKADDSEVRVIKRKKIAAAIAGALMVPLGAVGTVAVAASTGLIVPHIAGVSVAGAVIAGSSIKDLVDNARVEKKVSKYSAERSNAKIDEKTGFKLKKSEMDIKNDVKRVNPRYKDFYSQSKSNCVLCSVAYDLRRRGYDVTAKGAATGYDNVEVANWYKGIEYKPIRNAIQAIPSRYSAYTTKVRAKDVIDSLTEAGGRGIVNVFWPGGGGHAMAYDMVDGKPMVLDCQSGEIYKTRSQIAKAIDACQGAEYARIDNLQINSKRMLKEVVDQ